MLGLEFGVFGHLDDNGIPLAELFETRLKPTEQYFVADMAFGSLPYEIAARSVDLFAKEVMPAFRRAAACRDQIARSPMSNLASAGPATLRPASRA
jgi:hypothetical protein